MVRGLYTAMTGMVNQMNRMDVITNNLANSNTTAYKKEGATSQAFDRMLAIKINDDSEYNIDRPIGYASLGVKIGETYTNWDDGSFRQTGNTYDIALGGKGFLEVSFADANGNESVRYTRDGSLTTNVDGVLMTKDGDFILGTDGGIITIPTTATDVVIDDHGRITADGMEIAQLQITDFEDYNYLKKYGENMYIAVDGATQTTPTAKVYQGYLETSNVNAISEMVDMIAITRDYESSQKVLQAIDGTMERTVNLGRIS